MKRSNFANRLKQLALLFLGLAWMVGPLVAREPDEPPRQEDRTDRGRDDAPNLKHHGVLVGRVDSSKSGGKISRPDALPEDVKVMIEKFKADREKFLSQQAELERQLKKDSNANREELRAQLKASLDRWKDQQKEFRDRLKDRMKELELPEREDVLKKGQEGPGRHGGNGKPGS